MREEINLAVKVLNQGGVILYPTDTIWGIGCDATNEDAVKKIHQIKKSNEQKSMLILMNNINLIERYVAEVPEIAYDLIELTETPLTIIYPEARNLAKNLLAEDGSIGIRIVKDSFCNKLIQQFRKPIVSTSANIFQEKAPLSFSEISNEIKTRVDHIVKWGRHEQNTVKPSEIIKLGIGGEIEIIRKS